MSKKPATSSRSKKPTSVKDAVVRKADDGARLKIIEEMFNDFYYRRRKIYLVNFIRGICFGLGTAIGGTVIIALLLWILAQVGSVVPWLGDVISDIIDAVNTRGEAAR